MADASLVPCVVVRPKGMLTGECLRCNTLNVNIVYTRQLGQSIPCCGLFSHFTNSRSLSSP
jgi:hypothetical protein